MSPEPIDVLFLSYYADVDRWHNDWPAEVRRMPERATLQGGLDRTMMGRIERQSVRIDGRPYDLPRFLSFARYGDAREFRRYDAYTPTHLSGAFYESLLTRRGYGVRHVNYADRLVIEDLGRQVAPRFVLFSTTFMIEMPTILDGLRRARKAFPDALLLVGGFMLGEIERDVEPAVFQRFLRAWGADAYVVSALGEEPLLAMLEAQGRELEQLDLPATWVRTQTGDYRPPSPRAEQGISMDDTWVRWDELDPAGLYHTVHLRTARSCTFRCSFCSLFVVEGKMALAEPETLRRELEALARVPHVRSLVFTDDTFNVPQKRYVELVRVLADFDFEWYSFYRCQFAAEETVRLMRESGCKGLFLGLESVDEQVLRNMNKATRISSYERGLDQLARAGIPVHANFIVGFPGDRPENAQKVVDFVDRWDLAFYSVSPWFAAPSTPIWKERERYGVRGRYYDWTHDTMSSEQAIELEQWMIHAPRRAVYMSQLSADTFWSEIMLYCNGWTVDEARMAARTFNCFAGSDTPADVLRSAPQVAALRGLLARKELPQPARADCLGAQREGGILAASAPGARVQAEGHGGRR